jgi:hypothetical protein
MILVAFDAYKAYVSKPVRPLVRGAQHAGSEDGGK